MEQAGIVNPPIYHGELTAESKADETVVSEIDGSESENGEIDLPNNVSVTASSGLDCRMLAAAGPAVEEQQTATDFSKLSGRFSCLDGKLDCVVQMLLEQGQLLHVLSDKMATLQSALSSSDGKAKPTANASTQTDISTISHQSQPAHLSSSVASAAPTIPSVPSSSQRNTSTRLHPCTPNDVPTTSPVIASPSGACGHSTPVTSKSYSDAVKSSTLSTNTASVPSTSESSNDATTCPATSDEIDSAADAQLQPPPEGPSVLILHDSILGGVDATRLGRSYGLAVTKKTAFRIEHCCLHREESPPDVVVLHSGVNNLRWQSSQVASDKLVEAVNNMLDQSPTVRIVVSSVAPTLHSDINAKARDFNDRVVGRLQEHDRVTFVNNDYLSRHPARDIFIDSLHLSNGGSSLMAATLGRHLFRLLWQQPRRRLRRPRHHHVSVRNTRLRRPPLQAELFSSHNGLFSGPSHQQRRHDDYHRHTTVQNRPRYLDGQGQYDNSHRHTAEQDRPFYHYGQGRSESYHRYNHPNITPQPSRLISYV